MNIKRFTGLVMLILFLVAPTVYAADDFGIITDLSGKTELKRGNKNLPVSIGLNLSVGDSLLTARNSRITLVSYDQCLEWTINGPGNLELKYGGIVYNGKKFRHERRLPVCYSMTAVNNTSGKQMGGIVLRGAGPKDPVAELRDEFADGTATNSTVLTLLMHDLNNGNAEKARPYYEYLKKRLPDAEIIIRFSGVFEKK